MKTIYSSNPILTLSPDIEIIVDVPETKEVTFTLVTSKKSKKKEGQSVFFFRSRLLYLESSPGYF